MIKIDGVESQTFVRGDLVSVVFLGNCIDLIEHIDCIQYVVSDPPYGISYKSGKISKNSISTTKKRFSETIIGDDVQFDPSPFVKWPCSFTGAQWFYDRLPPGGTIHTWDKRGPYEQLDQADCDQIWCSIKAVPRKFECVWRGICRKSENHDKIVHPTQKPVSVMAFMMDQLRIPQGAFVLDPYMGSGTTGVACARTGRNFIGIEISKNHYFSAVQRIKAEMDQFELL